MLCQRTTTNEESYFEERGIGLSQAWCCSSQAHYNLRGLDLASSAQAVKDQVENHPEPYLLTIAFSILQENDLWAVRSESEKHLQLAVFNVVETISEAINNRQPA